jgi:hypothetical protein
MEAQLQHSSQLLSNQDPLFQICLSPKTSDCPIGEHSCPSPHIKQGGGANG